MPIDPKALILIRFEVPPDALDALIDELRWERCSIDEVDRYPDVVKVSARMPAAWVFRGPAPPDSRLRQRCDDSVMAMIRDGRPLEEVVTLTGLTPKQILAVVSRELRRLKARGGAAADQSPPASPSSVSPSPSPRER